ncbi:MAG TPA: TAXI family TRAP transporter solute-binding subunit [Pseudonocardiaceae bacterium]|nr:TAXI family TRAP transporter solute-binding subunit [Pseudonocardiaceae bacterium]
MPLGVRASRGPARVVALAGALLSGLALVSACQSSFPGLTLRIATGSSDGVYYEIGTELASSWAGALDIARPTVLETAGSPANIALLRSGAADIAFSSADAVADPDKGPRQLRALARIYDDYIQVVVRADLPIHKLADLSGRRVSVGPPTSQVHLVADRILAAGDVHDMASAELNLNDSISALKTGKIDAFFWSGGLPTPSIATLAQSVGIRLLDLGSDPSGVLPTMQKLHSVYSTAVVPAGTYEPGSPSVTTLVVPNFLLVTDRMSNDVAEALVRGLFNATGQLSGLNAAALAIDVHTAIYTEPVRLHPGAENYYRSSKI